MGPLLLAVPVVLLVLHVVLATRSRRRFCRPGCVPLGLRMKIQPGGRGWRHGTGRYAGDVLEWRRQNKYGSGPDLTLRRVNLVVRDERQVRKGELFVGSQCTVLSCRYQGEDVEVAVLTTGRDDFVAWVRAAG